MSQPTQKGEIKPPRPELVFGLVGAAGTDLNEVAERLTESLRTVDYQSKTLFMSKMIADLPKFNYLKKKDILEDQRIMESMKAGNELRRIFSSGDAVARLAIAAIRETRENQSGNSQKPLDSQAYIVKSLKHKDEYDCLSKVYGDKFILICVYEPKAKRINNLATRIGKSHNKIYDDRFIDVARELIDIDEKEDGVKLGQQMRDVFPLGDIFISVDDSMINQIERFIQILFQAPYKTPTPDEYGMFHARAAALRSADLSRQVGAVIATKEGEIVAAGCNEVPKAGGGSVWEGHVDSEKDYRDFRLGHDSSAMMKLEIVTEVFEELKENGWLDQSISNDEPRKIAERSLYDKDNPILKNTRITSILEYGRIVHAEMSAIMDAARRGIKIKETVLYCTTFPCHMCARHIMAAGIDRVVYIEPYPKSMAKDLYKESMCVDGSNINDEEVIRFEAFVGIAPKRYLNYFDMPESRKDTRGYALAEKAPQGLPRLGATFFLPSDLEVGYEESLQCEEYGLFKTDQNTPGSSFDGK